MKLKSSKWISIILKYILTARLDELFNFLIYFLNISRIMFQFPRAYLDYRSNTSTYARAHSTALHGRLVEHTKVLKVCRKLA